MEFKVKKPNQYIAFGNNGNKLGERSQTELRDLAIMALESQNPNLIGAFEGDLEDVDVEELKAERVAEQEKKSAKKSSTLTPAAKEAGDKNSAAPNQPSKGSTGENK